MVMIMLMEMGGLFRILLLLLLGYVRVVIIDPAILLVLLLVFLSDFVNIGLLLNSKIFDL